MSTIALKRDYVKVKNDVDQVIANGGNQCWFSNDRFHNIYEQGCGVISTVDAFIYLNSIDELSQDKYKSYVERFFNIIPYSHLFLHDILLINSAIGIIPIQICQYLKKVSNKELIAKWNGIHGHKNMLSKMEAMLAMDCPVIWSLYRFKKKINLYTYDNISQSYKIATTTNNHYVNAIGVIHSSNDIHNTMIKISSWGKLYFIDYDEYLAYVGNSIISKYCSNIVLIKKKHQ